MEAFDIYTKDGQQFSLDMEHFAVSSKDIALYDSNGNPAGDTAFLPFDEIAAIVQRNQEAKIETETTVKTIEFHVYLRKATTPVKVLAHIFDPKTLSFYWQQRYSKTGGTELHSDPIQGVYFATSEVVAVVPSGGLVAPPPSRW